MFKIGADIVKSQSHVTRVPLIVPIGAHHEPHIQCPKVKKVKK